MRLATWLIAATLASLALGANPPGALAQAADPAPAAPAQAAPALAAPALAGPVRATPVQAAPVQAAPAQQAPAPAPAPAPPPITAAATLAAVLPMQAAGFNRVGLTDFESRPGGAGLGAAAEYRPADGSAGVATLYQYSRGLVGLPEGAASPAVEQERRTGLGEIQSVAALRRYSVVNPAEAAPIPAPDGTPALRCTGMLLVYEGGVHEADSYLCAGVLHGRFLKLRLTMPAQRQGDAQPQLLALGQALVAALVRAG